jgi:predicted transcriptional regulator
MMRVLSAQRIRLLRVARKKATPVSDLAVGLKRDTRAVGRDVDLLERFGLLRTRYEKNPGHGKRRIVESRAAKYQLIATI